MSRLRRSAAALVLLALVSGCSSSTAHHTVTVLAAASLTDAFRAEAAAFHQAHPDQTVQFSFAGSQTLVAQVREGAPADVLATADLASMRTAGRLAQSVVFARNRLVIVVRHGNPHRIRTLADLTRPGLTVVLAGPTVPAGRYAATWLRTAGVHVHPATYAADVRGVLTDVELGEADAGIVYVTDARSGGDKVSTVAAPGSPVAIYPVVALDPAGQAFAAFLRSTAGQAVLREFGFLPP